LVSLSQSNVDSAFGLISCSIADFFVSGSFKVDSVEAKKKEENFRETLRDMANSKYEYVKSFELEDEVMLPNLMVVRIDGRDFSR